MSENIIEAAEKDYFTKKEMAERLKWLSVGICTLNLIIMLGLITLFVFYNPIPLLTSLVGIFIGFLSVKFYRKYKKK